MDLGVVEFIYLMIKNALRAMKLCAENTELFNQPPEF